MPLSSIELSIPSRRVGDRRRLAASSLPSAFPSPQGGSETGFEGKTYRQPILFPSPQGGSETTQIINASFIYRGFHPLKAGRRRNRHRHRRKDDVQFPSPQGGSETCTLRDFNAYPQRRFHPLKAGRRLTSLIGKKGKPTVSIPSRRVGDSPPLIPPPTTLSFPSPQGGSETECFYSPEVIRPRFHPLKAGRRP